MSSPRLRVIDGLPAEPSDDDLLAQCAMGRTQAFGVLVERYRSHVFKVFRRFASTEESIDLTQSCFLRVLEMASQGRCAPKGGFKAYLLRAALNVGLNHQRQSRRWRFAPAEELAQRSDRHTAVDSLEAQQTAHSLRTAALQLPERQREVLLLRIDGGLSFLEIGKALGIREGNAKSHFHLAMKKLREILGGADEL